MNLETALKESQKALYKGSASQRISTQNYPGELFLTKDALIYISSYPSYAEKIPLNTIANVYIKSLPSRLRIERINGKTETFGVLKRKVWIEQIKRVRGEA